MKTKTVEELRAQAGKLGLKGYAKLRKAELLKLLKLGAKNKLPSNSALAGKKPRAGRVKQKANTASKATSKKPGRPKSTTTSAPRVYASPTATNGEQQIESAKYAFTPPTLRQQHFDKQADLGEDIDRLPAIHSPLLCLLPQKPGVLLGYWMLPDSHGSETWLRLRLGLISGEQTVVLEERPLLATRGSWYFQIEKYTDLANIYLQLGHYLPDGQFVGATARSFARIPNLYASTRADRQWWISEAHLRELLRRNPGRALGWRTVDGLASSPGKHLAWFSGSGTR